jgi:hypothetical protein
MSLAHIDIGADTTYRHFSDDILRNVANGVQNIQNTPKAIHIG